MGLSIMVNFEIKIDMDMVSNYFQMDHNIKGIGRMIHFMDKVIFNSLIRIVIKESGLMASRRVLGSLLILMEIYIKDNGSMELRMGKDKRY